MQMNEQQKARIVELARMTENELKFAAPYATNDNMRFNARYAQRRYSDEAFRIVQESAK